MSQQIAQKKVENVHTVLPDLPSVYRRLRQTFGVNQAYTLFAEPIVMGNGERIAWQTERSGIPIKMSQLAEHDMQRAEAILQKQANELLRQTAMYQQDRALQQLVKDCLNAPGRDSLFLLKNEVTGEESIVVTEWSMTSSLPGSQRGWLYALIQAQRFDMVIEMRYNTPQKEPVPHQRITIKMGDHTSDYETNDGGQIILPLVKAGTTVEAIYSDSEGQIKSQSSFVCYENGIYQLLIDPPEAPVLPPPTTHNMQIQVVNGSKKTPVPTALVTLNNNGQIIRQITDEQGIAIFEGVTADHKYTINAQKNNQKGVSHIVFQAHHGVYQVPIRSRNWWWLLVLLLPLLLFIPIQSKIEIKVASAPNSQPVEQATVQFWCADTDTLSQTTDIQGMAVFEGLPRLFLWQNLAARFGYGTIPVMVTTGTTDCLTGDSIFSTLEQISVASLTDRTLIMHPVTTPIVIMVMEEDNGRQEPLPDIQVIIRTSEGNEQQGVSNAAGETAPLSMPVCATVKIFAVVDPQYYTSDTLQGTIASLAQPNPIVRRTLVLKPRKTVTSFFVKDTKTQNPIAGAKIIFSADGSVRNTRTTNIRGRLSVVDFEIYARDQIIELLGQHPAYHDSTLKDVAATLVQASEEKRTLWLRPREQTLLVKIVDKATGSPLAGAQLVVTEGTKKDIYTSNSNGEVLIPPMRNDAVISLVAAKADYLPNAQHKNKQAGSLKTPLIIPLNKEYLMPCDDSARPGGDGDTTIIIGLASNGTKVTRFELLYMTETQPDEIIVYYVSPQGIRGDRLWGTAGPISTGPNFESKIIDFTNQYPPTDRIAVRVIGDLTKKGTVWKVQVKCAN